MELNVNEASAKELLAYYQEKCDEEARQAKKEGRLVCWSAALHRQSFLKQWILLYAIRRRIQQAAVLKNVQWIYWKWQIRKDITLISVHM